MEKKFAVYSEKQKAIAGSWICQRPDGSEIEVTSIEDTEMCPIGCIFSDKVNVGEVIGFVKIGYEPPPRK